MRIKSLALRLAVLLGALSGALFMSPASHAGGPLLVQNGQPTLWPRHEVSGGPMNSQTVDTDGTILYRVDSGPLGPLSNAQAVHFADRIFGLYNSIPTSTIRFRNAGPILDPATRSAVDVNGSNVGKFLNFNNPTFQNPIIFDSDGSITGRGGVLGFFGFIAVDDQNNLLKEAYVVLNGGVLTSGSISTPSFLGVFTHEFGHFAGPLDHEQINGNIAAPIQGSEDPPPGFTRGSVFDLYAPFTETLFPFLYNAPGGSALSSKFPNSGFFVASLDMDTQNAVSDLYPTADYLASRGSIEGRVIIRAGGEEIPIDGVNVIARRIDQGPFPPPPGTVAYPSPPVVDADGVPSRPPAQSSTDSLATASSAVTGLNFGHGGYKVQGLPPGQYLVGIQEINPRAVAGSAIGPLTSQLTLPNQVEFYNGATSSNSPSVFVPVVVTAGGLTTGIDIVINGLSNQPLTLIDEVASPHFKSRQGQPVSFPCEISGSVSDQDNAQFRVILDSTGDSVFVQDFYQFTVTNTGTFFITLDGLLEESAGGGDIDLYLFTSDLPKKKISVNSSSIVSFSNGPTPHEVVAATLTPGTYVIGVSSAQGSQNYKLRILN